MNTYSIRIETRCDDTYTTIRQSFEAESEEEAINLAKIENPEASIIGPSARNPLDDRIECRVGCGACCVFARIPYPFQGHPNGKKAGERCVNLTEENTCGIYENRPEPCRNLQARSNFCGFSNEEAWEIQSTMTKIDKETVSEELRGILYA